MMEFFFRPFVQKLPEVFFNKPDKVAQINYDTHSDELVISWCDHDGNDDKGGGIMRGERDRLVCNEGWRGQID